MISCEFCEISKNILCYRTPLVSASAQKVLIWSLQGISGAKRVHPSLSTYTQFSKRLKFIPPDTHTYVAMEFSLSITETYVDQDPKVKDIPILKFQWACDHFMWPLSIFFGMLLGVTHCAQIFMVISCCTRPYLEKKCKSFKLLIKKVFCNMKACTLGSVLSYFPLSSKGKKTEN